MGQSFIDKLENEIQEKTALLQLLKKALEQYPDLDEQVDRWNTVRYCSALAIKDATNFVIGFACGCCDDSPLLIWPFLQINGNRIYTNPNNICIGEKDTCSIHGAYINEDWEDSFTKLGYSQEFISKLKAYLKENYSVEEEDDDE